MMRHPVIRHLQKMEESSKWKQVFLMIASTLIFLPIASSTLLIPEKMDGFLYKNVTSTKDSIMIEAFLDPMCPDSRDTWPPLKQIMEHYGSRLSLTVHPFALPYHDNSFVSCRTLHIVNKFNISATYPMMELFFGHQDELNNAETYKMSRESVLNRIINLVVHAIGNSSLPAVESSFNDVQTDLVTRFSFKYGCSKGVSATPSFFVNGFPLPDAGSAMEYDDWRQIIDQLVPPIAK